MRHNLVKSLNKFGAAMLSERDPEADVGFGNQLSQCQDLPSLVIANAKRAEEALRVIEELAKLPDLNTTLHSKDFEQARFNLYTLEKELLSRLMRRQKKQQLTGLYVIIDTQILGSRDGVDAAREALRGGAKVITLRDKQHGRGDLLV